MRRLGVWPGVRAAMTARLFVDHTWDGERLDPSQIAFVNVDIGKQAWELRIDAPFYGDPPPTAPPGPTPRLWESEVVELFVVGDGVSKQPRYTEIELGPHGHHLVLQFEGVRQVIAQGLPIEFEACVSGARWLGLAKIPAEFLPHGPWRINAYAAHGVGNRRRHFAMIPVPGPAPDFHNPFVFVPLVDE